MVKPDPIVTHRTDLHYKGGSSDKVYFIWIENVGANHVVRFLYGRRGNTLTPGTKYEGHAAGALKAYDAVVNEKIGKGYLKLSPERSLPAPASVARPDGRHASAWPPIGASTAVPSVPSVPAEAAKEEKKFVQLLNPVKVDELQRLLESPDWLAQEKFDGRRMVLSHHAGYVRAFNRKGEQVEPPAEFCSALQKSYGGYNFTIDGEACGDVYHAFDILDLEGQVAELVPYEDRLEMLGMLLRSADRPQAVIRLVKTADTPLLKKALLAKMKVEGREGVVFKLKTAPYKPGRPASGGDQLKYKLVQTATCIVTGVNDKRSIALAVRDTDAGNYRMVGNVTIPPNHEVPPVGAFVEVRYLYAYEGGSLFQPVYLGVRDDKKMADHIRSLKLKAAVYTEVA